MTGQQVFYRIVQPLDERKLCRVKYSYESIVCPINRLHQRMGQRTSALQVSMPRNVDHFCYSWGSQYIVSRALARALAQENLTGFHVQELANAEELRDFVELAVDWHGEFVRSTSTTVLVDHCAGCGLLEFSLKADPPWTKEDISSRFDFFILGPFNSVFCSAKAYSVIKERCANEFFAVPSADALQFDVPITTCSISWPPISPNLVWPHNDVIDSISALGKL